MDPINKTRSWLFKMISTTENIASLSTKKQTENKTNKCH